jgi:catechol 2,3-dioxygenase-like lactoylglutathione lyase family enzyme
MNEEFMKQKIGTLDCITLFVDGLKETRKFFEDHFGLDVIYEDSVSAVVTFGNVHLERTESHKLITPAKVGEASGGAKLMFTILVDNVDHEVERLKSLGISLLNGPIDRPWKRRTAAFLDPAGNAWEFAQKI